MSDRQKAEFKEKPAMNLAISLSEVGRFCVNIFRQRNEAAMVIRNIVTEIPNKDDLGLPDVLTKVIMAKRGLILFVGGTGSGKSTSLAALIDYRNTNSRGHIITIEDPVEYIHPHKGCIINQREVGMDTDSFEDALKNTLRQAPRSGIARPWNTHWHLPKPDIWRSRPCMPTMPTRRWTALSISFQKNAATSC